MYVPKPDGRQPWQAGGPAATLPDWHELLAAFCGHIGDEPDAHPVTGWARALAELHLARREFPLRTAEIDCRRAELVARIDEWIVARTRARRAGAQSLGAVVDGMAAAQVRAIAVLRSVEDVTDERVHTAWFLLASLADEWTGLVDQANRTVPPRAAGQ